MAILWSNNASSTVAGSITATATSVALAAGTGVKFPTPTGGDYFVATFYDQATKTINEIVHVTARAGDVCTIVRGQEGTTAVAWSAADIFANLVTAGTLRAFVQAGTGPADTSVVYVGTDVSTTPNLIVATTIPVPPSFEIGMLFNILVNNTNTDSTSLELNGLAPVRASRTDGSNLVGGNLHSSEEMIFVYNGVDFTAMVPPVPQSPPQTTFYVRMDGNDNNSGFANTSADAFRTISGGMAMIAARYISQSQITVRVADGLYLDGFVAQTGYISSWNIVGNPTNPGNVVIDATSTNASVYPPYANTGICCSAVGSGVLTVNGFTFKGYYGSLFGGYGGTLEALNCNFTATVSGQCGIEVGAGGSLTLYGNFNYTGATPNVSLFAAQSGGALDIGFFDVYSSHPVVFNIAAGAVFTGATAIGDVSGVITVYDSVTTFTGTVPNCKQYSANTGGGIDFMNGNTLVFPGALPGEIIPPGWIAQG